MSIFHSYTIEQACAFIQVRQGEEKLGERLHWGNPMHWEECLELPEVQIVILGIPEDIGVRANHGVGGTHSAWNAFMKSFLNIQAHSLPAEQIMILGYFEFPEKDEVSSIESLRARTEEVDEAVSAVLHKIVEKGKLPIIIGGGHNNSYPILKAFSQMQGGPVNAINLDPHADFRGLEGRHSGNAFSYAYNQGFLKKYAVLGLHEAYNNAAIMKQFAENEDLTFHSFEDIFMRRKTNFQTAMNACMQFVSEAAFGVEMDLDCLEDVLSSAETPLGIPRVDAWHYLYECAKSEQAAYLHLPEGISSRSDGREMPSIGKLISYYVQAFIKGCMER